MFMVNGCGQLNIVTDFDQMNRLVMESLDFVQELTRSTSVIYSQRVGVLFAPNNIIKSSRVKFNYVLTLLQHVIIRSEDTLTRIWLQSGRDQSE